MINTLIWFDARTVSSTHYKEIIETANQQSHFKAIFLNPSQIENYPIPKRLKLAVYINEWSEINNLEHEDNDIIVVSKNLSLLNDIKKTTNYDTAWYINIDDQNTMNQACDKGSENPYLLLEFKDDTNIPLELVLAKLQDKDVKIMKIVKNAEDGRISSDVMEIGSDGVVLASDSVEEIIQINGLAEKRSHIKMEFVKAVVTRVEHISAGERACIDTTSLLKPDEGMIIGSTSSGGLLVCSEVHYLPYMNTRPFRVNAGAVHSYVWCPEETTEYITDFRVGDQVLVVSHNGSARTANIGRVKIEVRPLLLIEAEYEGKIINTIVQDDWHIRIFDGDRQPKSATTFKKGDSILAYFCEPGRHVGVKISETITEK